MSEEQKNPFPPEFQADAKSMSEVKEHVMKVAQANPQPAIVTIARQMIDHLDVSFLLYESLYRELAARDAAVEDAVAKGNVTTMPTPGS